MPARTAPMLLRLLHPPHRRNFRWLAILALLLALAPSAGATGARAADPPPAEVSSPAWEQDIRRFAEADAGTPPPQGAVLFVGSSSIRLWDSLAEDFPGTAVVNRGFGGSEIRDSTWYADRIVVPYAPRTVVLYAGENDLASGRTPEQVRADFRAFVERVRRDLPDARIVFIAMKPSPSRAPLLESVRQANALVRDEASRWKDVAFVDVFTPMLGPDGQGRPELFGADRLHMNARGYALWRDIVAPAIAR